MYNKLGVRALSSYSHNRLRTAGDSLDCTLEAVHNMMYMAGCVSGRSYHIARDAPRL